MESCKCPITDEIFGDPVMGDDGHTYERKAITEWLTKNGTSPMTRQPMDVNSLKTNYMVKKMVEELQSMRQLQQVQCQFQLDVDIRKTRPRPLFQGFGKSIYEVEWINRDGPPIILLKIDGAKANREASFYVQLSCHPHIVRTFGFVQCNPGSIMLLQECAPHGDLSEMLRENGFKPTERVLWDIFEQICDAMVCLADNGIVHGDLACRNVLVFRSNATQPKENLVKLTDFGLTRGSKLYSVIDSPALTTMTIIPVRYVAPEILRSSDRSSYSERSDVYSMGVLMWEACSYGQLPYASLENDNEVRRRKLNDERLPQPSQCSHQLWNTMNSCWHLDPQHRPTFKILEESLSTPETKSTNRQQQSFSSTSNSPSETPSLQKSNDIVYIPCESCNELIELSNWSTHIETCRKTSPERIDNPARNTSKQSVTEQLPCEFCQRFYSSNELSQHQTNCYKNPRNTKLTKTKSSAASDSVNSISDRAQSHSRAGSTPSFSKESYTDKASAHYTEPSTRNPDNKNSPRNARSRLYGRPMNPFRSKNADDSSEIDPTIEDSSRRIRSRPSGRSMKPFRSKDADDSFEIKTNTKASPMFIPARPSSRSVKSFESDDEDDSLQIKTNTKASSMSIPARPSSRSVKSFESDDEDDSLQIKRNTKASPMFIPARPSSRSVKSFESDDEDDSLQIKRNTKASPMFIPARPSSRSMNLLQSNDADDSLQIKTNTKASPMFIPARPSSRSMNLLQSNDADDSLQIKTNTKASSMSIAARPSSRSVKSFESDDEDDSLQIKTNTKASPMFIPARPSSRSVKSFESDDEDDSLQIKTNTKDSSMSVRSRLTYKPMKHGLRDNEDCF